MIFPGCPGGGLMDRGLLVQRLDKAGDDHAGLAIDPLDLFMRLFRAYLFPHLETGEMDGQVGLVSR
jgi:hypothetical protein